MKMEMSSAHEVVGRIAENVTEVTSWWKLMFIKWLISGRYSVHIIIVTIIVIITVIMWNKFALAAYSDTISRSLLPSIFRRGEAGKLGKWWKISIDIDLCTLSSLNLWEHVKPMCQNLWKQFKINISLFDTTVKFE